MTTLPKTRMLLVKNFPATESGSVIQVFKKYGHIDSVKFVREGFSGSDCIVRFSTDQQATQARKNLNKQLIKNQTIKVEYYRDLDIMIPKKEEKKIPIMDRIKKTTDIKEQAEAKKEKESPKDKEKEQSQEKNSIEAAENGTTAAASNVKLQTQTSREERKEPSQSILQLQSFMNKDLESKMEASSLQRLPSYTMDPPPENSQKNDRSSPDSKNQAANAENKDLSRVDPSQWYQNLKSQSIDLDKEASSVKKDASRSFRFHDATIQEENREQQSPNGSRKQSTTLHRSQSRSFHQENSNDQPLDIRQPQGKSNEDEQFHRDINSSSNNNNNNNTSHNLGYSGELVRQTSSSIDKKVNNNNGGGNYPNDAIIDEQSSRNPSQSNNNNTNLGGSNFSYQEGSRYESDLNKRDDLPSSKNKQKYRGGGGGGVGGGSYKYDKVHRRSREREREREKDMSSRERYLRDRDQRDRDYRDHPYEDHRGDYDYGRGDRPRGGDREMRYGSREYPDYGMSDREYRERDRLKDKERDRERDRDRDRDRDRGGYKDYDYRSSRKRSPSPYSKYSSRHDIDDRRMRRRSRSHSREHYYGGGNSSRRYYDERDRYMDKDPKYRRSSRSRSDSYSRMRNSKDNHPHDGSQSLSQREAYHNSSLGYPYSVLPPNYSQPPPGNYYNQTSANYPSYKRYDSGNNNGKLGDNTQDNNNTPLPNLLTSHSVPPTTTMQGIIESEQQKGINLQKSQSDIQQETQKPPENEHASSPKRSRSGGSISSSNKAQVETKLTTTTTEKNEQENSQRPTQEKNEQLSKTNSTNNEMTNKSNNKATTQQNITSPTASTSNGNNTTKTNQSNTQKETSADVKESKQTLKQQTSVESNTNTAHTVSNDKDSKIISEEEELKEQQQVQQQQQQQLEQSKDKIKDEKIEEKMEEQVVKEEIIVQESEEVLKFKAKWATLPDFLQANLFEYLMLGGDQKKLFTTIKKRR